MRSNTFLRSLLFLLLNLSAAAEAAPSILLQYYVGDRPEDAKNYIDFLTRTLGEEVPLQGAALQQDIEARLSLAAGPLTKPPNIQKMVEAGRRLFIEGEYQEAIAQLEKVQRVLLERVALVASDQSLRETRRKALLFLAHAYVRAGQKEQATKRISEVIRSFPGQDLPLAQFSPELVKLYKTVHRTLSQKDRGKLVVTTQPTGSMVFVNERYVGLSPAELPDLYPGTYRIYVQRPNAMARVHLLEVGSGQHKLEIDYNLDCALQTAPYIGFRFEDDRALETSEVRYAATVGRALEAPTVLLVGFRRHQGRRALHGTIISSATGQVIRSGLVELEPDPPSPAALKALGRYLIAGETPGPGVIVNKLAGSDRWASQSHRPTAAEAAERQGKGFAVARFFKWLTLGIAVAGIASGITLIALNGDSTCKSAGEGGTGLCPEKYNTLTPGIVLIGVGGLSAISSAILFYVDSGRSTTRRAPGKATLLPYYPGRGAGLGLAGSWSF